MQIFSKSHLDLCNLLNINKIQRYNLLHAKRPPVEIRPADGDITAGGPPPWRTRHGIITFNSG